VSLKSKDETARRQSTHVITGVRRQKQQKQQQQQRLALAMMPLPHR
jgi:hypothetical protein